MQIMITHGSLARTRVYQLRPVTLGLGIAACVTVLLLVAGLAYHALFMAAARQGWPVAGELVRSVLQDQLAQRDRYMRENLDAMAARVGEMQAKLGQLEALSDRVSGLAGVKPEDTRLPPTPAAQKGGPYLPISPSLDQVNAALDELGQSTNERSDVFTYVESRLFESRMASLMIPTSKPIDGPISSGFGFRTDPFTGHIALHPGIDFPAPIGTPIHAAAGGVVIAAELHGGYGNMIMVDHGNGLVTRYGHCSRLIAKVGDLVKRGDVIAEVGSTGRSTGPHLHFEVLVEGVHQDPAKFLFGPQDKLAIELKAGRFDAPPADAAADGSN